MVSVPLFRRPLFKVAAMKGHHVLLPQLINSLVHFSVKSSLRTRFGTNHGKNSMRFCIVFRRIAFNRKLNRIKLDLNSLPEAGNEAIEIHGEITSICISISNDTKFE
jgi:hypothetical protein